ncbi:DUF4244 domain-containing protein [Kocuria sp.]|uniref:DUF4244 domain-containing protein n=1 Tax=Kocuria sp. TaxID=1871328 RepID=UPI0026DF6F12|nr:DUF4244 domain-containing protein [Kocuria sp.]MDO5618563.1 DUF4244 domain-containing protein [Kocuria sp.]
MFTNNNSVAATSVEAPADQALEGQVVAPGTEVLAQDPDLGASTVEYAIVLLAAAAFGGVMAAVIASDAVSDLIMAIINKALGI